jgi:hypothetical protein
MNQKFPGQHTISSPRERGAVICSAKRLINTQKQTISPKPETLVLEPVLEREAGGRRCGVISMPNAVARNELPNQDENYNKKHTPTTKTLDAQAEHGFGSDALHKTRMRLCQMMVEQGTDHKGPSVGCVDQRWRLKTISGEGVAFKVYEKSDHAVGQSEQCGVFRHH